jgi:peroxiredoxin
MDYQALGLGDAASVVTGVAVDKDKHTITIACLYDPQNTPMPYTLCFKQCEHIAWQIFDELPNLQQLDAELIGLSLDTSGAQHRAVLTTNVFELSFIYGSFSLHTPTSASYPTRT